ncbi:sigma-54-dependent Fis family transcriptional regulator [Candidatus Uabimicrobium amorphum]|uniref:Sigma-54-dependent Fis family transcriptional regulator n=1 Tax=Uabimicrobium amorphum TaxID=2596890 RepID=A0A5S9F226_UABAM|nr:sigma 54-interacting transcriptional regulator [Candidatus Uabimicrobium amorphum]BBM83227.1 sigma-54-dependent Fis family transcriptional regulator [Candidatus Uabimicrobium amorphum]
MSAKEKLQFLLDTYKSDAHSEKYWNVFCASYEKHGIDYLRRLLSVEKQLFYLQKNLNDINAGFELPTLLQSVLDHAIELTNAERGVLLLNDLEIARNFAQEHIDGDLKISRKLARQVMDHGKAVLTDNAQGDQRFSPYTSVQEHRLVSIICVPLKVRNKNLGAIYLDNRLVMANFEEDELAVLCAFAQQVSLAIENVFLHARMSQRAQQAEEMNIALRDQVKSQTAELTKQIFPVGNYWKICAESEEMQQVFAVIEKVKNSELPVLVCGESGTGKELIAQALHFMGNRKDCSFVSENCAAIPESIFESELFGYEAGAFTGAKKGKKGLFEESHGGTLFLDEIGELPIALQKKLLRTLAEKKIRRVGAHKSIEIDTRIVTATNRDLRQMIREGSFREDLFYRLNVVEIYLPPLRKRRGDIPILIEYFIREYCKTAKMSMRRVSQKVIDMMMSYEWPGNIRQLRNELHRMLTLCDGDLTIDCLSPEIQGRKSTTVTNLPELLREVERNEIEKAMKMCQNNKSKASQVLGISRFSLQRKLEKYQM